VRYIFFFIHSFNIYSFNIYTPVHSVTLGLPCRSVWPQLWAHLWCNPDWTTPTPTQLCMECQHLTCTNYSLPKILLLVWFLAIFQQVSDLVTSTSFLSNTEYSSNSLHLPIRPLQPVSHLISIRFPPTTSAIMSSPFFNPAVTTPSTIYAYRFWSARLCNMEFHSYFHQKLLVHL